MVDLGAATHRFITAKTGREELRQDCRSLSAACSKLCATRGAGLEPVGWQTTPCPGPAGSRRGPEPDPFWGHGAVLGTKEPEPPTLIRPIGCRDQTSLTAHCLYHAVKKFDFPDPSLPFVLDLVPQHSILPPQVFDMGLEAKNFSPGIYSRWR
jgi:hypothetical protein